MINKMNLNYPNQIWYNLLRYSQIFFLTWLLIGLNVNAQIISHDDSIVANKAPQSPAADHSRELNCLESGLPFLKNYTSREYQANGQNWAIVQDKNGFMYFGNTDGYVLQYDGVSWRKIPVSNGSIVRSLAIDSTGVIYVGAQNEFMNRRQIAG